MLPGVFDIRVLGPVEVVGADGAVFVGGPTRRALLGLLALRARQVVSQDALVDGLWDERPPVSAQKSLHAHVAHLRRALETAGLGRLLGTKPPGYLLAAPPEHVDADRFARLIRADRGEPPDRVAERLRAALALWRGDVLADCAVGEWARAEAARLHEARLYAVEGLFTAELAMNRHRAVVAELESVVGRHPLRERLWELLMLALHRDGRQGDALRAYRRAHSVLVAELGVGPGPTLRRLEAAIRAGEEPAAPRAVTTRAPGPGPAPAVPVPLTSLVGRSKDIAELTGLLTERRLVTLTGVGGSGKTRLAIAVATAVAATDGHVGFVDLTAVTDPGLVPAAACDALGVRDDPTPDALVRRLRDRELLLVLDNCEHVLGACRSLVETLLHACPWLRVLATSCETLGVAGETTWPVQPLPTPGHGVDTLAELHGYDAVRLFLDRATLPAVRALGDADAPALAAICAGLDGLPLALELAAARTAVLTVAEIAERLRDPAVLRGHRHPDRPHHRALDATVAWSYDALDPAMRARLRGLAVFAGGFTLEAAAAVWLETEGGTVDALADLVAKSLVVVDQRGGRTRYRLLETIRHFAAVRLDDVPDERRAARQRHASHHLALAVDADRRLRGPDSSRWLDRLAAEHENLRAALAWFATDGSPEELRLAVALARYCRLRGRYDEGRRWLLDALERGADAGADRAPALLAVAFLAYFRGSYAQAARYARSALAEHRAAANPAGAARSLRLLGSIACERGEYERSTAWYAEALAEYRCVDDESGQADVLQMTGFVAWLAGDLAAAGPVLEQALLRYGALDDPENLASTRVHLAAVALYSGDGGLARRLAEDAMAHFAGLDFKEGIAWAMNILGLVALHDGQVDHAMTALHTSLGIHHDVGDRWRQASLLDALAVGHLARDDPARAARLTGLAAAMRDELGVPVPTVEQPALACLTTAITARLTDQQRHAALARGATMTVPDILAEPHPQ